MFFFCFFFHCFFTGAVGFHGLLSAKLFGNTGTKASIERQKMDKSWNHNLTFQTNPTYQKIFYASVSDLTKEIVAMQTFNAHSSPKKDKDIIWKQLMLKGHECWNKNCDLFQSEKMKGALTLATDLHVELYTAAALRLYAEQPPLDINILLNRRPKISHGHNNLCIVTPYHVKYPFFLDCFFFCFFFGYYFIICSFFFVFFFFKVFIGNSYEKYYQMGCLCNLH